MIAGQVNSRLEAIVALSLVGEVQKILEPIHNWHYIEGRPKNND